MSTSNRIAILAGDGIGPEVMAQALRVLRKIAEKFKLNFEYSTALIGGAAYNQYQNHCPAETLKICEDSDAILFGSVGGPINESNLEKWKNCEANSILALRKAFSFNANFRPARVYKELEAICPLKPELLEKGVDVLIIRELLGDIYFGEHKEYLENNKRKASDVAVYDEDQISSIARIGFDAASKRRKKLTSVDKANVLATSKLWRQVVSEIAQEYPSVQYENMLVDNCAMQIIKNPAQFDVILTSNLFGDILSDAAAVLPGSLGLTPSASLNANGFGLYEPSGGSAPDIAGTGLANPLAQILSAAMMLRYSFGLNNEADSIENAVEAILKAGFRTKDIAQENETCLSCEAITNKILDVL
jgi:3-isopropylmalate dehydrogenase